MRLFISYRRADTLHVSGRMKSELEDVRGVDEVFFDFDSIEYGEDFERRITRALGRSSHCLVIMGEQWAGDDGAGNRRIDNPKDFVRQEVARALTSKARVLPVLIDGARMPSKEELPDDLKELSSINALELRSSHFMKDLEGIVDVVFGATKRSRLTGLSPLVRFRNVSLGVLAALAIVFLLAVINAAVSTGCPTLACRIQSWFGLPSQERGLQVLLVLVVITLAASAGAADWWGRRKAAVRGFGGSKPI